MILWYPEAALAKKKSGHYWYARQEAQVKAETGVEVTTENSKDAKEEAEAESDTIMVDENA